MGLDLPKIFFRGAAAAAFVFDIANRQSFERLNDWIAKFRAESSAVLDGACCVLIGNKSDLRGDGEDKAFVTSQEALQFAERNEMKYFESSVKNYVNLDEPFQWLADEAARRLQSGRLVIPDRSSKVT